MFYWYFGSGDLDFFWKEQLKALSWAPQVFLQNLGFGADMLLSLWLGYPFRFLLKFLSSLGLSWFIIEKLLWISVFALAVYSSYMLAKKILGKNIFTYLAPIIYAGNTYILLLFGGGQLGVALAYSLSPLVLLKFIQQIDKSSWFLVPSSLKRNKSLEFENQEPRTKNKELIKNGLLLALLVCFDLRIAYLVMGAVILYFVLRIIYNHGHKTETNKPCLPAGRNKQNTLSAFCSLLFALCIAGMVHLFWILPMVMVRTGVSLVGEDFTNIGMLKFLSVADFSHALSLLAPNWPENLFGKVYFLHPEFLILPILAFASLLFTNYQITNYPHAPLRASELRMKKMNSLSAIRYQSIYIVYFAILALFGAFLAKGTNDPFGGVFVWMFANIPGFVMFRDPTKFYLFIALGYSILIPFTLYSLSNSESRIMNLVGKKSVIRYPISAIIVILFIVFWLFTIRAVFTSQAAGNFRPLTLSHEYIQLKDMLVKDADPYRTLWLPSADKFMYSSDVHPVLSADTLWKNASSAVLLTTIESPEFLKTIHDGGVRYVIIPQDLEKRMFLSDYKFDASKRDRLIEAMERTGLPRLSGFQDLVIFENPTYEFSVVIPEYVESQEYWARIGLGLSIISLILFFGLALYRSKKTSTQ